MTIVLPIIILFCACGTVVANECRINPYSNNTRRILTSVSIYAGAFLGILGLIIYISFIGTKAYGDYEMTAQLIDGFVELKGCSDKVLDAAGAMGDKMHANEMRLYLIAFLSISTGALVFIMYMVLFTVPLCC